MPEDERITVTVLYSPAPREVEEWQVTLPAGATVLQALRASPLGRLLPESELAHVSVGIWGRRTGLDAVLRQADRVELYRPLRVDPKLARRERFQKQGMRAAGLFARRNADEDGRR